MRNFEAPSMWLISKMPAGENPSVDQHNLWYQMPAWTHQAVEKVLLAYSCKKRDAQDAVDAAKTELDEFHAEHAVDEHAFTPKEVKEREKIRKKLTAVFKREEENSRICVSPKIARRLCISIPKHNRNSVELS